MGRHHETGFLNRTVTVSGTYRFQVFLPDDWTGHKKWPVILFMHGAGERSDDGLAQTGIGIGGAIRLKAEPDLPTWLFAQHLAVYRCSAF